jgi:regulator of protease activity HflC (stomatin/prohibitin superfamily)
MPIAVIGIIFALTVVILYNTIKVLKEYERGVVFFLGRYQAVKGPGLIILIPGLQKMTKVEHRVIVKDVKTHDDISRDKV